MTRKHWLSLAAMTVALAGVWAWVRSLPDCEPSLQLVLLAEGKPPWLWERSPARYRFSVTGADLDAGIQFDAPFTGAVGSSRLSVREHEKGVVAFELRSPPPRFRVALELDGARVFEREFAFSNAARPCPRQSLDVDLPHSVAERVGATNPESDVKKGVHHDRL